MTFDLQNNFTIEDFETLAQAADPSAALQREDSLPETEPPAAIRSLLYRFVFIKRYHHPVQASADVAQPSKACVDVHVDA